MFCWAGKVISHPITRATALEEALPDQAVTDGLHSADAARTPKMPGEPPRVQPSKKVAEHWDAAGERVVD